MIALCTITQRVNCYKSVAFFVFVWYNPLDNEKEVVIILSEERKKGIIKTIVFMLTFSLALTSFVSAAPTGTLKVGSKGADVLDLQQKLVAGGFLEESYATGFFGPNTEEAVKKYQASNDITQTGIVSDLTIDSLYSGNAIDTSLVLEDGDSGTNVTKLQKALNSLGFLGESYITGTYGEITENAVKRFQGAYDINQTGVAAQKTLEKLNSLTDITKIDTSRVYRVGDDDAGVKAMQQRLCNLGFLESKYVTGYFGAITVAAVKSFQKANNIPQTGTVAEMTINVLNSTSAKTSTTSSASDLIAKPGTLRLGDSGTKVKNLQKNLKTLGYFSGDATGTFGDKTKEAVIKFQKAHSLTADGIATEKTLSKISASISAKSAKPSSSSGATVSGYTSANTSLINSALSSLSESELAEVRLLARLIKREVGGKSYRCQLAVGSVVMNRVKRSKISVREVIFAKNQFSTANSTLDSEAYSTSNYYAAIEAYMGVKPIGNCLYFCSSSVRNSCWAGKNRTFYCTIDSECFFL